MPALYQERVADGRKGCRGESVGMRNCNLVNAEQAIPFAR